MLFFLLHLPAKNNNKYSLVKILHVRIDELLRTLVFLNSNFGPFLISPIRIQFESPAGVRMNYRLNVQCKYHPSENIERATFSQCMSTKILFFYFPLSIAKILNTSTYGNAMIIPLPRETDSNFSSSPYGVSKNTRLITYPPTFKVN